MGLWAGQAERKRRARVAVSGGRFPQRRPSQHHRHQPHRDHGNRNQQRRGSRHRGGRAMSKQRRALRVAAGLALAVGLAACAGQPPQPDPDPTPTEALPALSEERVDMILADLQETLEEADAERDPELLTARVAGPALEMRRAEYELSEAANEDRVPTVVSTASQVQVIAATEEWPRSLFVVSEIPEGENLPLLLVLTQEDPRSQYKLTSWTPLLPGAATPPMAKADAGSEMLAADGGDLRLSPQDAVAQYGQLLAGGDDEEATFAEDPFRERYVDAVSQLAETVEVDRKSVV